MNARGGCLSAMTARVRLGWIDEIQGIEWGIVWNEMVSEDEREGVLGMCESSDGVRW